MLLTLTWLVAHQLAVIMLTRTRTRLALSLCLCFVCVHGAWDDEKATIQQSLANFIVGKISFHPLCASTTDGETRRWDQKFKRLNVSDHSTISLFTFQFPNTLSRPKSKRQRRGWGWEAHILSILRKAVKNVNKAWKMSWTTGWELRNWDERQKTFEHGDHRGNRMRERKQQRDLQWLRWSAVDGTINCSVCVGMLRFYLLDRARSKYSHDINCVCFSVVSKTTNCFVCYFFSKRSQTLAFFFDSFRCLIFAGKFTNSFLISDQVNIFVLEWWNSFHYAMLGLTFVHDESACYFVFRGF